MRALPPNWAAAQIGELCHLINGKAFKPSDWSSSGLPIIRIQNLNNPDAKFNHFAGEAEERFVVEPGELLFAWSGTPGTSFGAHVWSGSKAVLNQHIFRVRFPEEHFDKEFFRLAINECLDELVGKAHGGVGLGHITKGRFEETELPVPPLPEQRRIVARIEELRARSGQARRALAGVPALIDRYRKTMLAAAFCGDLTADWREERGRDAGDHGVPASWREQPFGSLIDDGPTNGYSPRASETGKGPLALKLTATTRGVLDLSPGAVKRIATEIHDGSKFWLDPGDLLIQRANTIDYVGAAAIYDGPRRTYIYPDLMMRVRVRKAVLRQYLWRYLNSPRARMYFQENATGTAGNMPKINGQTLRALPVPVPPADERAEIVRSIEASERRLASIGPMTKNAIDRLADLDRTILVKAFRGELVPQDPNDEPASVLLERIRAEREAQPLGRRRGRRVAPGY